MFKPLMLVGVLLLCAEVLSVDSNDALRHADRRVINNGGMEYLLQQQLVAGQPSPGFTSYAELAGQTTPSTADLQKNVRTIIVMKKVPVPYPVHIEKKIPYPVKVPIRRPYVVYVPRPYQVEVMKQVPFPVKVPYPHPYTVEKHVPVPYKVHYDKPYPVHITKPYPVYFEKRIPIHVEKPVPVQYRVAVDRPFPIHVPIEKPMLYPVERPYHFPLKVPVDKPVAVPTQVDKPYALPVSMEKPHVTNEHSVGTEYLVPTQATDHSTFSPSPYDELTSTLLTQGKHKVISFLPGSSHDSSSGSFADHSEEVGTIHVSNIKNDGNSTDWVPKYVPNNQYLTYVPTDPQNKFLNYVIPEKTTKLNAVNPAEPFAVKPTSSVKMHYKLHYDPVKQEYSFKLVPKVTHSESVHQSSSENNQQISVGQNNHGEYVYKSLQDYSSSTNVPNLTQSTEGFTYDYSQIFKDQNKPELNSIQPNGNDQTLSYAYQSGNPVQTPPQKQEHSYTIHGIDTSGKIISDGNIQHFAEQSSAQNPKVTFTYQTVHSPNKELYQSLPLSNEGNHQVSYTYQTADDGSAQNQLKNSDVYPQQEVKYMYVPQEQAGGTTYSEVKGSHLLGSYSISHDQKDHSTNYPHVLYQQGNGMTIYKDGLESTQPTFTFPYQGGIPENYKTSRTSESLTLYQYGNSENVSGERVGGNEAERKLSSYSDNTYEADTVSKSVTNETDKTGMPPSIYYEKFNYNDVMVPQRALRTKLYPVNISASEYQEDIEVETSKPEPDYELKTLSANYFQSDDSSTSATTTTTDPLSTKVYHRLHHQKHAKTRRLNKRKKSDDTTSEDHTQRFRDENSRSGFSTSTRRYEEINSSKRKKSPVEWYELFTTANSNDTSTSNGSSSKDTNSHTGAAKRTPFYGYLTAPGGSSNATTTNSLLPPDDVTPKPRSRATSRGSVRAFGRKKETSEVGYTTTEETPSISSSSPRRKRRPARRRMDRISGETTTENYPVQFSESYPTYRE